VGLLNEIASDDDVRKHGLDALRRQYHPFDSRPPEEMKYSWTVDKDRDLYLVSVDQGRDEHGNRTTFILAIRGQRFEVDLDLQAEGSSGSLDDRPFRMSWAFVRSMPKLSDDRERPVVLDILRESLGLFGYRRAWQQVPDTIVSFLC
jgi:hypothetical protein